MISPRLHSPYGDEVQEPRRLASNRHTAILVAILLAIAAAGLASSRRTGSAAHDSRLPTYAVLAAGQILLVRYVRAGLRKQGRSLVEEGGLDGVRAGSWATDVLVAILFVAVSRLFLLGFHRLVGQDDAQTGFLLPHNLVEKIAWVLLSVVAGACEELTFRTYLQRQFGAIAGSGAVGVMLQAAIFGVSHGYQGWKPMVTITLFGILFGLLAWWRGNVRSAMIAHTAVDVFGGLFPS